MGMGGGTKRRGPSQEIGLAVSDQMGSVRIVTWSIWTSTLAWPIQVTLGGLCRALSRSQAPSLGDQLRRAGAPEQRAHGPPQEERQGDGGPGRS